MTMLLICSPTQAFAAGTVQHLLGSDSDSASTGTGRYCSSSIAGYITGPDWIFSFRSPDSGSYTSSEFVLSDHDSSGQYYSSYTFSVSNGSAGKVTLYPGIKYSGSASSRVSNCHIGSDGNPIWQSSNNVVVFEGSKVITSGYIGNMVLTYESGTKTEKPSQPDQNVTIACAPTTGVAPDGLDKLGLASAGIGLAATGVSLKRRSREA